MGAKVEKNLENFFCMKHGIKARSHSRNGLFARMMLNSSQLKLVEGKHVHALGSTCSSHKKRGKKMTSHLAMLQKEQKGRKILTK
jgi:hypothetical protein